MELANQPRAQENGSVRLATAADASAIMRLLKTARFTHIHADWHLPVDWLGTRGFVVQQAGEAIRPRLPSSLVTKLLGPDRGLRACLAVAADPPPAAWVRVASLANEESAIETLAEMLSQVTRFLQESAVTVLGWLAANGWPDWWLTEVGFKKVNHIQTYLKSDLRVPDVDLVPGLHIRQVRADDLTPLEKIEAAAFDPLWRHSATGLELARYQSIGFDVALLDGYPVGFQLSAQGESMAHLVRLTVSPDCQGHGIGGALLAHAIRGYQAMGLRQVSLNTQTDNVPSQRLYEKFGFRETGQRAPVWAIEL